MSLFTDFLKSIRYRFDNLKDKGLPPTSFDISSFFGDIPEQYPDRYNFYIQLLESLNSANPEAVYFLLSKENLQRINKQRKNKSLKVIDDFFQEKMMDLKDLRDNLTTNTIEVYKTTPLENLNQLQRELSKNGNTPTVLSIKNILNKSLQNESIRQLFGIQTDLKEVGDRIIQDVTDKVNQLPYANASTLDRKQIIETTNHTIDTVIKQEDATIDTLKDSIITELEKIKNPTKSIKTIIDQTTQAAETAINTPITEASDKLKKIIDRKKLLLELKDIDSKIQKVVGKNDKHIKIGNLKVSEVVKGGGLDEFKKRIFGDEAPSRFEQDGKLNKDSVTDEDLERFHRDPVYSPENEQITMVDRVVFIAATYIIRAISMFLLEWAVHINFINTFVKGFALYFGVYFCIFILLYMLTNASEKDEVFRMIFYYIYTKSDGDNGLVRIWAHLLCVFMLIPIPFVVREYREFEKDSMTFAEKRTILTGVSRFSLYIWLLTSLVALKV